MSEPRRLPMFPLGTVLLPGQALPLQIFEPRYRVMMQTCLEGPPEFGVVLIERGSEVGGGDVRSSLGTVARIVEATELPDGRWLLIATGAQRIRVIEWQEDDPHPWALVEDWPDPPAEPATITDLVDTATVSVRRLLALATELGRDTPPSTFDLPEDPVAASYLLATLPPFGAFDRQKLLGAASVEERLDLTATWATEMRATLSQALGNG